MRARSGNNRRWNGEKRRMLWACCLCVAMVLGVGAGTALAVEDQKQAANANADNQSSSSIERLTVEEAAAASKAEQQEEGDDDAEDESDEVEPSSEVVTSYYHDDWYDAGASEDGGSESDGESKPSSDSQAAEAADSDSSESAQAELDPQLNDLGVSNLIDLQQTPDGSYLYDSSFEQLMTTAQNGSLVQIRGEVVGDAIRAEQNDGKYWITLDPVVNREAVEEPDAEDGRNVADFAGESISVLVDEQVLDIIDTYGGYNRTGTILRVRGTYYTACPSHEGIRDIHANEVTRISEGVVEQDEFDLYAYLPGAILALVGLLLMIVYRLLRERQR